MLARWHVHGCHRLLRLLEHVAYTHLTVICKLSLSITYREKIIYCYGTTVAENDLIVLEL